MKVAHINFSDTNGGAAIATGRIHNSLLKEKIFRTKFTKKNGRKMFD